MIYNDRGNRVISYAEMLAAVRSGKTDRQIAEQFGVSPWIAWQTRTHYGIATYTSEPFIAKEVQEALADLYRKGYTDHKMAKTVGISTGAVKAWRQRTNRPSTMAVEYGHASQAEKDYCLSCTKKKCSGNCEEYKNAGKN